MGVDFKSVEHAYQYEKAMVNSATDLAIEIKEAVDARKAKLV
jgi:hypothetical protein